MGFSFEMTGFDELINRLEKVKWALQNLNGCITNVTLSPLDDASVEAAIKEANAEIDRRLAAFSNDQTVSAIASQFKEKAASQIPQRAEAARKQRQA